MIKIKSASQVGKHWPGSILQCGVFPPRCIDPIGRNNIEKPAGEAWLLKFAGAADYHPPRHFTVSAENGRPRPERDVVADLQEVVPAASPRCASKVRGAGHTGARSGVQGANMASLTMEGWSDRYCGQKT